MLNVEGRNIADEGFSGSNVRDSNTGRFTSEGANSLAQNVRAGMSMTSTRDSSATNISAAVAKLTKAIANDTQSFQKLLNNQNEKTKELFDSYIKSLESGKTGNIEKAMEKFLLSMEKDTSARFEKIIDAVGQRKSLNEGNTVKQKFANFMGADADKGFGGSIAQAFTEPGRMFGKSGLLGTGLFSGGPTAVQQQAAAELGKETQSKGTVEVVDKLIRKSENESVSEIQANNNKEKVAEKGSSNKKGPEKIIIADQPIITKDAPKTVSGIDRNDPAAEQLQVLKDMLKELKTISGRSAGGSGGGLVSTALSAATTVGLGAATLGLGKKALGGVKNIFRGRAGILRAGVGALTAGGLANSVGDVVPEGVNNNTRVPATATPVPPGDMTTSNKIPKNSSAGAGSKWDRFIKFLTRKAPRLLAKIGPRLATMAGLLLVPGPGWVAAIISMGFNIMLAWELYGYWKEFSNSPDGELDETEQVQQESITSPNITSEGTATPVIPERDPNRFDGMSPSLANAQRRREEAVDRAAVSNAGGTMIGNEPFYPGQTEPLTDVQMAALEAQTMQGNSLESFSPEIQEKYNQQQQDQGSSLGTATPTATTSGVVEGAATPTARTPNESDVAVAKIIEAQTGPVAAMNYLDNISLGREQTLPIREIVEGTAENVSTTPETRRQRMEREQGFGGTTSGAPIVALNPKERQERAMELAEQMNLNPDPTNLDVEYTGQVPSEINGVAVPSELLTEEEKYQQNSAQSAREMLQGTQSEVAARQSVTSNAIQNMTDLSSPSTQSAPPIINNITNNNTSASSAAPQILTTPSTPRNNNNVIQRFQDKTFAGI